MHAFLSSADFFKINFLENCFSNNIRVSNTLDPDQARHFVGPDLGPNCLQRLSADDTSFFPINENLVICVFSWYTKAQQIAPKNGRPYNQLAILAVYTVR